MDEMRKIRKLSDMCGKSIVRLHDGLDSWKSYVCRAVVPSDRHLMSFDLVFNRGPKRTVLCLDNYGNETMDSDMHQTIFGRDQFEYLVGIDRQTGAVLCVTFYDGGPGYIDVVISDLLFGSCTFHVPQKYLGRLDELKCQKRPWSISIADTALFGFISRWASCGHLQDNVIIRLAFKDMTLALGNMCFREETCWENI